MTERISRVEHSRRRTANGTYAMRPGESFPISVDAPLTGSGSLDLYVPVDLDLALRQRDYYRRWATAMPRILAALDADDREPWLRKWSADFGGSPVVVLFYLLQYDVDAHYMVDPRKTLSYAAFRYTTMGEHQAAMYFVFTPHVEIFAESYRGRLSEMEGERAFNEQVALPVARGTAVIMREAVVMLVGGEVIRLGGWLLAWGNDLRVVTSVVQRVMLLGEQYRSANIAIGFTDKLFASALMPLSHRLLQALDVVGTHDVLLEIVPPLVELERRIADRLAILVGLHDAGSTVLDGWVLEDDPVERAYEAAMVARMSELTK